MITTASPCDWRPGKLGRGVGMNGRLNPDYQTHMGKSGSPKGREPYGDGAAVVVRARESLVHGEGRQVDPTDIAQGREMRFAGAMDRETWRMDATWGHWRAGCGESCQSGSWEGLLEKGSPPVPRKGIRTPAQAEYLASILLHLPVLRRSSHQFTESRARWAWKA